MVGGVGEGGVVVAGVVAGCGAACVRLGGDVGGDVGAGDCVEELSRVCAVRAGVVVTVAVGTSLMVAGLGG